MDVWVVSMDECARLTRDFHGWCIDEGKIHRQMRVSRTYSWLTEEQRLIHKGEIVEYTKVSEKSNIK